MLKPMDEWVVTRVVDIEEEKKGKVILLNPIKKEYKFVQVMDIGPNGNPLDDFKVGDIIMVHTQTGLKVTHEEKDYELHKAKNFFGIWTPSDDQEK